ncbi:hypothetical protein Taro_033048 [Colocasia esculenta]|uniref:Uncharacterized protein n=1 Tax=Colocasia esculenta TaxID=4460 RepID=A0A843VWP1_COLES|nr:hypothetical protein [Colocasia esculenta]
MLPLSSINGQAVSLSSLGQNSELFSLPWLREVGVTERWPVRTSRDVRSGRSSRPRHRRVLYFPHSRLWIMECSYKAMQTQAHTQAALQAQLEAHERADVWWASLLRTWFEDGAVDVAWDEFTSAGSSAWSVSPSSGSSSSASYRKTRKALSPSSSRLASARYPLPVS